MSAKKKGLNKPKISKKSKSPKKSSLKPKSLLESRNKKGSVTLHLEAINGKVSYFFVRPKKKFLEVWIFLPRQIEGLVTMQGPTKKKKYSNLFKVVHADQIEEPLTDWIREAFDFAPGL